jgi:hypothetical protein
VIKKYEVKIVSQVDVEGCDNISRAQNDGWELAGDIKIGYTHPNNGGDKMIHAPMKREIT